MPRVSIIMGVYNIKDKDRLKYAVDSILNQTFRDFEFIICDDGSTNDTYNIINSLTKNDNRVILIRHNVNHGLATALNSCLNIAKGEYIARMDDDDYSEPERLDEQIRFLDANRNYDIVGCNANLFDDKGIWGERINLEVPQKRDFLFGSRFMHPTIVVRKEVYENLNGYRISKETMRGQDYDLFLRAYGLGYRGYNIQKKLYHYREDANSYKKRNYKNRINEAIVRYKGFKMMGVRLIDYMYVAKPLFVGLIPNKLMKLIRENKIF